MAMRVKCVVVLFARRLACVQTSPNKGNRRRLHAGNTSAGTAKMQTLLVRYTITNIRQQLNAVKFCADIYSIFTDVPL